VALIHVPFAQDLDLSVVADSTPQEDHLRQQSRDGAFAFSTQEEELSLLETKAADVREPRAQSPVDATYYESFCQVMKDIPLAQKEFSKK
jgi:hypothetical protein